MAQHEPKFTEHKYQFSYKVYVNIFIDKHTCFLTILSQCSCYTTASHSGGLVLMQEKFCSV
jgi:hypothetical protein